MRAVLYVVCCDICCVDVTGVCDVYGMCSLSCGVGVVLYFIFNGCVLGCVVRVRACLCVSVSERVPCGCECAC